MIRELYVDRSSGVKLLAILIAASVLLIALFLVLPFLAGLLMLGWLVSLLTMALGAYRRAIGTGTRKDSGRRRVIKGEYRVLKAHG